MNDSENKDANNTINPIDSTYDSSKPKPKSKAKKAGRNSDIYERFINRVQSSNSKDNNASDQSTNQSTKAKKSSVSAYESLSLEESPATVKPKIDIESKVKVEVTDFTLECEAKSKPETKPSILPIKDNAATKATYSEIKAATLDEPENLDHDQPLDQPKPNDKDHNPEITSKPKAKLEKANLDVASAAHHSSIKVDPHKRGITLLIIGIICGLLIIAALVAALIVLNTEDKSEDRSQAAVTSTDDTAMATVDKTANEMTDALVADDRSVATNNDASASDTDTDTGTDMGTDTDASEDIKSPLNQSAVSKETGDQSLSSDKAAITQKQKADMTAKQETDTVSDTASDTNLEPEISLDDFKKEAQSTLYREIKD